PVRRGDEVTGLLTLGAIRNLPRDEWNTTYVRDLQEPLSESCTVATADPLDEVVGKLMTGELHRVLVTDDGEIAGIITPHDLGLWLDRSRRLGLTDERRDRLAASGSRERGDVSWRGRGG